MEASQTGQTGDGSQVSQETPSSDSQLQTPQGDQPIPKETERNGEGQETQAENATPSDAPSGEGQDAAPQGDGIKYDDPFPRRESTSEPVDQNAAEDQRQRELAAQRQEHNSRTGGADVGETDLQDARQEHNDRTGGGSVPGTASESSDDAPESD